MVGLITLQGKDSHGNPIFSGTLEGIFEMLVDLVLGGADCNHTMVPSDKWTTKYDDGTYGGCTGSVERNESDIILSPVDYPTQNFETVDPYGVFFEEPVAIVSTYNPTNGTIEVDILSAAATVFTWDLWLLVLTTFALSSLVWFLGNRRHKVKKNALFEVFSLFVSQESFEQTSLFSNIFATFLSLGVFILMNYYCNMMTTEMVIPDKPFMFDSLDKIMSKPETIPRFVSIYETYRVFKFAEEGNPKKKFWNKYAHLEETNEIFMDMTNIESARNHMYQGYIGKAVTIMNRLWVPLLTSSSCRLLVSGNGGLSRLLSSTIFPDEVYQFGVVRNARLRTTDYGKYLKKRTTLFFESGLAAFSRKGLEKDILYSSFDYEEFRKCMIDTYSNPDVNVSRVSMGNLKNVMLFYVTCIVIALISLVVEKIMPKKRKVTKVHPIKEKITEKPSKFKRALVLSLDMRPLKRNTRRRSF